MGSERATILVVVAVAVGWAAAGCQEGLTFQRAGGPCRADSDCTLPLRCVGFVCADSEGTWSEEPYAQPDAGQDASEDGGGEDAGEDAGEDVPESDAFSCEPGLGLCAGERLALVCRPDGSAFDMTECGPDEDCQLGACLPRGSCQEGTSRCRGEVVEVCDGARWVTGQRCDAGLICQGGECVEEGRECDLGARRCAGDRVQTCGDEGRWLDGERCGLLGRACVAGACSGDPAALNIVASGLDYARGPYAPGAIFTPALEVRVEGGAGLRWEGTCSLWVSPDEALEVDRDTAIWQQSATVAAGESLRFPFDEPLTLPLLAPGPWWAILECDHLDDRVVEADEGDNLRIGQRFTVNRGGGPDLPDLTPSRLSVVPSSPVPGTRVFFDFDVSNRGAAAAPSARAVLYLSDDEVWSSEDAEATSFEIGALEVGETLSSRGEFMLPPRALPLVFPILVVDPFGAVAESNEDNNARPGPPLPVEVDPGFCEDALDPNETLAGARPLDAGSFAQLAICDGESDHYLLCPPGAPAGSVRVDVELVFNHAQGDIDLDLLNVDGNAITGSYGVTNMEFATTRLDPGACVVARVFLCCGGGPSTYDLQVSFQ